VNDDAAQGHGGQEKIMSDHVLTILQTAFTGVSAETIQQIYAASRLASYPPGTVLIKQDQIEHTFYVLVAGQCNVFQYFEGANFLVDYVKPGQFFGELALILDVPRSAEIVTSETVTVLEITRDDFDAHIKPNADTLLALVRAILQRILERDQKIGQLVRHKQFEARTPEIFISYARSDEAFARRLAQDLIKQNFHVWLDVLHIEAGMGWSRQIGKALDTCPILLLIMTPDSLESENVEDEWNFYLDKQKTVIPILYRPCAIPYRLHKLQYIDFTRKAYDVAFARVVSDLLAKLS
jgi:CRP-like cAMP-binding protein